jgi:putative SOS response-associated peptidase YedK
MESAGIAQPVFVRDQESNMCGRFGATFNYRNLKILWNLHGDLLDFGPRYNIAPSQDVPVIVSNNDHNELKSMRWGLVPSWAQDRSIGQRMINARCETLLEKPSFRQLVSERRCLVPASGFYEWRKEGKRKIPMWIHLKDRQPFVFAGLWDRWIDRDSRAELYSFTIITTRPNALLKPIHDRMPVIYDAEMGRQWLRGPFGGRRMELDLVLQPLPSELMAAHEVSTLVNAPENDSPECIRPLPPGYVPRGQLPLV